MSGTLQQTDLSYRWNIAARSLLAFIGGLIWVSVFGALISVFFDRIGLMPMVQAAHVMTLFSFLPWCGIAMWVFYERTLKKLVSWLSISSLLMYLVFVLVK